MSIQLVFFDKIDTAEKAYLYGVIASCGVMYTGQQPAERKVILVKLEKKHEHVLVLLNKYLHSSKVFEENVNIYCTNNASTIDKHYDIEIHQWPEIVDNIAGGYNIFYRQTVIADGYNMTIFKNHFMRGMFDMKGSFEGLYKSVTIPNYPQNLIDCAKEWKFTYEKGALTFSGINAIDFLSGIYQESDLHIYSSKYKTYCSWVDFYNTEVNKSYSNGNFKALWKKNDSNALAPRKNRFSDSGYDLAVIKKDKQLTSTTALYDTGISIKPPIGYYIDVVPRSSISKSGYMIANSTGIIDASYSGSIKIALTKIDNTCPDIVFPCYIAQMIVRKFIHVDFEQVEELEETERAEKGFGSTEK